MKFIRLFLLLICSLSVFANTEATHTAVASHADPLPSAQSNQAQRYVCPMHQHIVRDHPGKCPICGMDLVLQSPVLASESSATVTVSGAMQQNLALTTAVVEQQPLWRYIETFGTVQFDERQTMHIHPRASGWLESLTVRAVGEPVSKGQLLYELYSPELVSAQEDYLLLLRNQQRDARQFAALKQQARSRLALLGLSDGVIDTIEKSQQALLRVPYFAPFSGVVTKLGVQHGMYVQPGVEMMTVANTNEVWLLTDVFEKQIDWVRTGKWVEIDLPALKLFAKEAKVDYLYPELDAKTRTLKVRVSLPNPEGQFKPGMLATVRIYGGPTEPVLQIPSNALIRTEQQSRVIVQTADQQFAVRQVSIGDVVRDRVEILSGLQAGERVVTSGQFLLDSEASLQQSLQRLQPSSADASSMAMPAGHQH